jgi:outer membrane protein OmpA-like peptidoglycan-associated protein
MFRQASLIVAKWPLKLHPATSSVALGLALLALGCGGTTTFQDTTPIKIAVAPPAPPPVADPPPPEPPKQVKIRDNRIELGQKIQFALNKSEILPASFSLMDELAKTIQENPQVQKVSIEGHASNEGQAQYNLALSKARAEAVRAYLVSKGVAADRLSSSGFGATKPIATNDNEEGREKNRRVEFHITKQEVTKEKVEVDSAGKEKVIEKTSANEEAPK